MSRFAGRMVRSLVFPGRVAAPRCARLLWHRPLHRIGQSSKVRHPLGGLGGLLWSRTEGGPEHRDHGRGDGEQPPDECGHGLRVTPQSICRVRPADYRRHSPRLSRGPRVSELPFAFPKRAEACYPGGFVMREPTVLPRPRQRITPLSHLPMLTTLGKGCGLSAAGWGWTVHSPVDDAGGNHRF